MARAPLFRSGTHCDAADRVLPHPAGPRNRARHRGRDMRVITALVRREKHFVAILTIPRRGTEGSNPSPSSAELSCELAFLVAQWRAHSPPLGLLPPRRTAASLDKPPRHRMADVPSGFASTHRYGHSPTAMGRAPESQVRTRLLAREGCGHARVRRIRLFPVRRRDRRDLSKRTRMLGRRRG